MPQAWSPTSPYATIRSPRYTFGPLQEERGHGGRRRVPRTDPSHWSPEQVAEAINAYAPPETSPILEKLALDKQIDGRTLVTLSEDIFTSLTGDDRLGHDLTDVSERVRRRTSTVRAPRTPRTRPLRLIVEELSSYELSPQESSAAVSSPPESEALPTPQTDYVPEWDFDVTSDLGNQGVSQGALINLGIDTEDVPPDSLLFPGSDSVLSVLQMPMPLSHLHEPLIGDALDASTSQLQDDIDAVGSGDRPVSQDGLPIRQDMTSNPPDNDEDAHAVVREDTHVDTSTQTDELEELRPFEHHFADAWTQTESVDEVDSPTSTETVRSPATDMEDSLVDGRVSGHESIATISDATIAEQTSVVTEDASSHAHDQDDPEQINNASSEGGDIYGPVEQPNTNPDTVIDRSQTVVADGTHLAEPVAASSDAEEGECTSTEKVEEIQSEVVATHNPSELPQPHHGHLGGDEVSEGASAGRAAATTETSVHGNGGQGNQRDVGKAAPVPVDPTSTETIAEDQHSEGTLEGPSCPHEGDQTEENSPNAEEDDQQLLSGKGASDDTSTPTNPNIPQEVRTTAEGSSNQQLPSAQVSASVPETPEGGSENAASTAGAGKLHTHERLDGSSCFVLARTDMNDRSDSQRSRFVCRWTQPGSGGEGVHNIASTMPSKLDEGNPEGANEQDQLPTTASEGTRRDVQDGQAQADTNPNSDADQSGGVGFEEHVAGDGEVQGDGGHQQDVASESEGGRSNADGATTEQLSSEAPALRMESDRTNQGANQASKDKEVMDDYEEIDLDVPPDGSCRAGEEELDGEVQATVQTSSGDHEEEREERSSAVAHEERGETHPEDTNDVQEEEDEWQIIDRQGRPTRPQLERVQSANNAGAITVSPREAASPSGWSPSTEGYETGGNINEGKALHPGNRASS